MSKKEEFVQIRDFPRSILEEAQKMFPDASYKNAVAAALAYFTGMDTSDLPETIQALVANYRASYIDELHKNQTNFLEHLEDLIKRLGQVQSLSKARTEENSLMISLLMAERFGWLDSQTVPVQPADIDYDASKMVRDVTARARKKIIAREMEHERRIGARHEGDTQ